MTLSLKSSRFRQEREADWRRLEDLLNRFEKGKRASLSDDEVIAIPVLYRATLTSLSMARAISLDNSLIDYRESLSARAFFCGYGARTNLWERAARFFVRDWPDAVRSLWRETLVSGALTLLGTVVAYVLVQRSPEWFAAFVPAELVEGRDPTASFKMLHDTLHNTHGADGLAVFSTFLFTHNSQIALLAFALGFAFCLPTAVLMIYNGLMLGAFFAVFAEHGLGVEFAAWALIHGTTELFAVTLAGAAGFHIGWGLAFPGALSRLEALTDRRRTKGGRGDGRRRGHAGMRGPSRRLWPPARAKHGFATRHRRRDADDVVRLFLPAETRAVNAATKPPPSQYALPEARVRELVTPEGIDLRIVLADGGERAAAFLLDLAIILGVLIGMTIVLAIAGAILNFAIGELIGVVWLLAFFFLRNFYFTAFELTPRAATPGKRALGLRVAMRDGGPLTAEAIFSRNVMREIELFVPLTLVFAVGFSANAWASSDGADLVRRLRAVSALQQGPSARRRPRRRHLGGARAEARARRRPRRRRDPDRGSVQRRGARCLRREGAHRARGGVAPPRSRDAEGRGRAYPVQDRRAAFRQPARVPAGLLQGAAPASGVAPALRPPPQGQIRQAVSAQANTSASSSEPAPSLTTRSS